MKILITGNAGYIGPTLAKSLRNHFPDCTLVGFDTCFFAHCLTGVSKHPEATIDVQLMGDIRDITADALQGVDSVIHLAAISNDPMGKSFESVTEEINHKASIRLAKLAKASGVKNFTFASSCSIYGFADGDARTENDTLNPLTAYARSKVMTEQDLEALASNEFIVTCHRFATACGISDRLRLDLVLNDFVAGAISNQRIDILSDGTPWRPLICVSDMALAMLWSVQRSVDNGGTFVAVNTGSNEWNFQVNQLASAVADSIENVTVNVNKDAEPDKRSYKVNFDLFTKLAPGFLPKQTLKSTIDDLAQLLQHMNFSDDNYRNSDFMRLHVLNSLQRKELLNKELRWDDKRTA